MTTPNGFQYINTQFKTYCQRHAENPAAPLELYRRFLEHAKEQQHYGWMKLASKHRSALLRTAYVVLARIYGHEAIQRRMKR